jgi:hypothetical protein
MVYNTTDKIVVIFNGTVWKKPDGTTYLSCGWPVIVNHLAGSVAPVSKTVTYGTVKDIPGETALCWITRNLGADQQAVSKDDPTEASAGWYWQFNRKQGYTHDGATLTPAWTITSIDENANCQPADDPCTIELGSGWRIPTYTEWSNVDASGGWTNWTVAWNSALKLHAGGILDNAGTLLARGQNGYYWSSTQHSNTNGWTLILSSNDCGMSFENKAFGFTLRCVRE